MTFDAHEPIISGVVYRIAEVGDAHTPSDLADFVGNTDLLVRTDSDEHHISGVGAYSSDGVRFYEKDLQNEGKDVRMWTIQHSDDGGFTAQHIAAM